MRLGIVFGMLAGAVWGMVFLIPALLPQFPPLLLACARYLMYGLLVLVFAWPWLPRLFRRLTRTDVLLLLELALTGNLVYYLLVALGVQLAGVAATSLIVGATPVVITVMGRKDAGAARLSQLMLPIVLVLLGVLCINLDVLLGAQTQTRSVAERMLGMACAAGSVLSWSWYAVRNARFLKAQDRYSGQQWSLLWGVATGLVGSAVWLLAWLLPADWVRAPDATPQDWIWFWSLNLSLAVACSWFGNWMWNAASQRLPLTLGGQMLVFETLFALLYGFIWAQRGPSVLEMIAIVLLIKGVLLAARRHGA